MNTSLAKKALKPNIRLRYFRKMKHWTQAALAEELYKLCSRKEERDRGIINANMIGSWERGEHLPSPFWQKKLCILFGATPDALGFLEATLPPAQAKEPPLAAPPASLGDISLYYALAEYLQRQRNLLADALAPGSSSLRVGDIIGDERLFIPLPWTSSQGVTSSRNLVEYLVEALLRGQRLLLLGDAGQGKTTVLKQVFAGLADRFLANPSHQYPFPLYLPLREFASFTGNTFDLLWSQLSDDFPLSYEQFVALVRKKLVVFLLDGFDEIRGELSQRSINDRAACKIFAYPSVLSCRKHFFKFYLSMSPLLECYPYQVELQPLSLTGPVLDYIAAFCQHKQQRSEVQLPSPQHIVETIQTNQVLFDLAQRPLLLLMILEVFTDPKEMQESQWSITKLYQKYTKRWLKHEASKPDSILRWHEKATLLQELAWFSYTEHTSSASVYRATQHIAITHEELQAFIRSIAGRFPVEAHQLLDDLCFRTLLGMSEGETYAFLHKSFQEYYVARYALECMCSQKLEAIEGVFQASLPFDVALFLKDLLFECAPYEKSLIATNLMNLYLRHRADDERATTIRQQASHYLTTLGTETAIRFLEEVGSEETNKWVQRGIMVGLALYSGRAEMLERYIHIIRQDQEAAAINLSYHLIYYGDQDQRLNVPLQPVGECGKTIHALFRHLRDRRYQNGWALDILTLSALLEQRGVSILQAWQVSFLKGFLQRDHSELGEIFQQEKDRLHRLLGGAASWN